MYSQWAGTGANYLLMRNAVGFMSRIFARRSSVGENYDLRSFVGEEQTIVFALRSSALGAMNKMVGCTNEQHRKPATFYFYATRVWLTFLYSDIRLWSFVKCGTK